MAKTPTLEDVETWEKASTNVPHFQEEGFFEHYEAEFSITTLLLPDLDDLVSVNIFLLAHDPAQESHFEPCHLFGLI
jgi:hypothetical protein